jgi:hypothetical protein
VRVTRDGAPRSGIPITWGISHGSIVPTTGATNALGIAEAQWTLGTATGPQLAVATIRGTTAPTRFIATALPGEPGLITLLGGFQVPANDYEAPLTARVVDRFGNHATGAVLQWSVDDGPAVVRWSDNVVGPDGQASAGIDPTGTAGQIRIRLGAATNEVAAIAVIVATEPSYYIKIFAAWEGKSGFFSARNLSHPAVDTVPAGATVSWGWTPDEFGQSQDLHAVESIGTPAFPGGPVPEEGGLQVVFSQPGVYLYRDPHTGQTGTLVVQ